MRPASPLRVLAAALLLLPGAAGAAPPADPPLRIAFLGPLSGPLAKSGGESLAGLRAAAAGWAHRRPVEVVPFDDRDEGKGAEAALAEIQRKSFDAVVAASTGVTVDLVAGRARRGRTPFLFVGSAPPPASADLADPVVFIGAWPVDQALNMAAFLAIHSEKEALGLYRDSFEIGIVAEDTERGRELADALARNLGPRQRVAGRIPVPPHGGPSKEALQALRAARCDRIVLIGEPDLVDRTAEGLKAAGWEVPLFLADGMLSRAAESLHDGTVKRANALLGGPQKALPDGRPVKEAAVPGEGGREVRTYARTVNGWFAGFLLTRAAEKAKRPGGAELTAQIRLLAYGEEERGRPFVDDAGRAALYQWFLWTMGEGGPAPIKPEYLPTRDLGPPLRMLKPEHWDRVAIDADTRVVWLTFGEKEPKVKSDPPRTIEEDMAALGLGTMGYEAELDPWLLDELMARALGKINRLFLKNYDGTFVPGVSYNIHFTATKPEHLKPSQYWVGIIAGEDADDPNAPGGRVLGGGKVGIYSRWMRKYTDLRNRALRPRMSREDRKYMDGTYAWGTTLEENFRSDGLRALVDGYASFFAMTGAHEFGHVCGCGHDVETTRSIMNVRDAVGLRDTQAHWIPMHVKALETALGRYPAKKR